MNSIRTAIELVDRMTAPMMTIQRTIDATVNNMAEMQAAGVANSATLAQMQSNLESLDSVFRVSHDTIHATQETLGRAAEEQARLNDEMSRGAGAAGNLTGKMGGLVSALGGYFTLRAGINYIKGSLDLTNQQIAAEQTLANVLANQGASQAEYLALKQKAAALQGTTMYSSSSMVAGAGELSSYLTDTNATQLMMDTLADYAAGMSGGQPVSQKQMVEYATQLGKALEGRFDGLSDKGFALTDAQKEIIEYGSDMEKALTLNEVISSWAGMAEQMANTPLGMQEQMTNSLNQMRADFGATIYPAFMEFFQIVQDNMPQIQSFIASLTPPIMLMVRALAMGVNMWNKFGGAIMPVLGALAAYKTAMMIVTTYEKISNFVKFMSILLSGAQTAESRKAAAASFAETAGIKAKTAAQWAHNAALWANPYFMMAAAGAVVIGASLFGGTLSSASTYTTYNENTALMNAVNSIEENTRTQLDYSEEELKLWRDIAERETINQFTAATVHVEFGGITQNVSSNADLDEIVDYITEKTEESLQTVVQGVHS